MRLKLYRRNRPLNRDDSLRVNAAQCWITLGILEEANRELEGIRPRNRRHPEVQKVREQLQAATRYVAELIKDDRILQPYWDADEDEENEPQLEWAVAQN